MNTENNIAIIILAAGQSSRIGSPKQLLTYDDHTFLQHVINVAEESKADSVTVVLGANADMIKAEMKSIRTQFIINSHWKEGMASTIRFGIETVAKSNTHIDAVLLMVADQPFVSTSLLNDLIDLHNKHRHLIIACKYDDSFGIPVVFTKDFFPALMQLEGDIGAKKIIQEHINEVAFVPFPKGNIDIDTMDDYGELTSV